MCPQVGRLRLRGRQGDPGGPGQVPRGPVGPAQPETGRLREEDRPQPREELGPGNAAPGGRGGLPQRHHGERGAHSGAGALSGEGAEGGGRQRARLRETPA